MPSKDAKSPSRTSRPVRALLIGLVASVVVAGAHWMGLDRTAELEALDLRFKHLSTAPPNTHILHVDIDDASLDQMGRWPWPRKQLAGIVEVLERCGARAVALDIELPEPQELRYESPAEKIYSGDMGDLINLTPPQRVFDDEEFLRTLQAHGNIFLPMHINITRDNSPSSSLEARVRAMLEAKGDMPFSAVTEKAATRGAAQAKPTQVQDFRRAYLHARSQLAMRRFALSSGDVGDCPSPGGQLVAPVAIFGSAIGHSGFVTVDPDSDGTVRRIPLLAHSGPSVFPQFALAIAAQQLAFDHGGSCRITASRSAVTLVCADGMRRVIPVDAEGKLLINWIRPGSPQASPVHIPARSIGHVLSLQESLDQLGRLRRVFQVRLALVMGDYGKDLRDLFARADKLYMDRTEQLIKLARARLYEPASIPGEPTDLIARETAIEKDIDAGAADLRDEYYLGKLSPAARAEAMDLLRKLDGLSRQQKDIQASAAHEMERLRTYVQGKICMVGSAATGAADFVPTPISNRLPGVVVHSNIFNTIVSGVFVRRMPSWMDLLAVLLCGGAVTVLAATRPVVTQAAPISLVLAIAYALFNSCALFGLWNYWLAMVAPIVAMLTSFVAVTTYRQLTEERSKKQIRSMFAHALSPALVDRLIDDPSLAQLGGHRRELTCFFSDIEGYTPLSERLGEQQTVRLLNRYFDRMTEIVQNRRGGYLNKFLGDGMFVFFGAPVFQDDHAARALEAALDCQQEVGLLNEELQREFGGLVHLRVRIGIATGDVMVGNCGSTQRMDYTAIGDSVNLASRLDGANKFFHTRILLSETSWQRAGDGNWLARPLGLVIVVGKQEPVRLYNLLGRSSDQSSGRIRQMCTDFAAAVDHFSLERFDQAGKLFESVLSAIPDDGPSKVYLELCQKYQAQGPPPDWSGVLRLTEK